MRFKLKSYIFLYMRKRSIRLGAVNAVIYPLLTIILVLGCSIELLLRMISSIFHVVWVDEDNPPVSWRGSMYFIARTPRSELSLVEILLEISLQSSLPVPPWFFVFFFFERKLLKSISASSAMCKGSRHCVMLRCRCIFLVLNRASFISSSECPHWNARRFLRLYLFIWS